MSDGAPEQSMEDILASIKRVINADVTRRPGGITSVSPAESDDDVLELGEPLATMPAEAPASAPGASQPAPAPRAPDSLLSGASMEASKAALAQLASISVNPAADTNTLDGLVREMLRPMLKAWLDANLPELVERIVAREVARVVGR